MFNPFIKEKFILKLKFLIIALTILTEVKIGCNAPKTEFKVRKKMRVGCPKKFGRVSEFGQRSTSLEQGLRPIKGDGLKITAH